MNFGKRRDARRGPAREPLVGIRGTSSSPLDVEPAEARESYGLGCSPRTGGHIQGHRRAPHPARPATLTRTPTGMVVIRGQEALMCES
jgi:hypothetical protein